MLEFIAVVIMLALFYLVIVVFTSAGIAKIIWIAYAIFASLFVIYFLVQLYGEIKEERKKYGHVKPSVMVSNILGEAISMLICQAILFAIALIIYKITSVVGGWFDLV